MEEEPREILREGLTEESVARLNLADAIRRHLAPLGGVELQLPKRELDRNR
jgi:plasmid stability protein